MSERRGEKRKLQRDIVLNVVEEIPDAEGKTVQYKCRASSDENNPCSYIQTVFVPGNFKRHLQNLHPDVAKELGFALKEEPPAKKPRTSKLIVESSLSQVVLGTLEMATENNMPLRFPEWKGTQTLIAPLWNAAGLKMSPEILTELIGNAASLMRKVISEELTGKVICLKIDSASRKGRSVFGINLQYIDKNGQVRIRHLALHEMVERQTKENLQKVMEDELKLIGVDLQQVLTITHDNGANMVASVRCLKALLSHRETDDHEPLSSIFQNEECILPFIEKKEDENGICTDDSGNDEEEANANLDESDDPLQDDFVDGDGNDDFSMDDTDEAEQPVLLESIRCGAHSAQLAVWDVIKPYKRRLNEINKLCIKMRHKEFQHLFKCYKVPAPPKVNETRWNVWYILLQYVMSLKEHPILSMLKNQDSTLDFSRHWSFIAKFCEAFKPMFVLTMQLQKNHVPLSQLYVDWLTCMAKLKTINGNTLAKKLLKAMETRIQKLKGNITFLTCLYFDPRFIYIGSKRISAEEKEAVQKYLMTLNKKLDQLSSNETHEESMDQGQQEYRNDIVEDFLAELFEEDTELSVPDRESADSLLGEIVKLESRPKVNITTSRPNDTSNRSTEPQPGTSKAVSSAAHTPFDLVEYLKKKKVVYPRLYRLARAVIAVPATQVTVERLFSQFKLVLTDNRLRLTDNNIKNLMILKMNQDLLPKVVEQLLELGYVRKAI